MTGLVGLGALLALAPDSPQRLEELLFGDPLGVTDGDLVAAGRARCCSAAPCSPRSTARSRRSPSTRPAPRRRALRPGLVRLALLALLAAAVAVAVQGLGALLVLAVLVAPPVAVRSRARTPAGAMLAGAAVAVAAAVIGMAVSFHAHSAAGASVALALCAAAALGALLRPSRGAARRGAPRLSPRRGPASPGL